MADERIRLRRVDSGHRLAFRAQPLNPRMRNYRNNAREAPRYRPGANGATVNSDRDRTLVVHCSNPRQS